MSWLTNAWYQAGWAEEVIAGAPLVRTILNLPILIWRDDEGRVAALLDRCPHRFAPLSAGRIEGDRVTCGYHGLSFDWAGACVHNPHGPVTSAMKIRAFPVEERHGALWIWMGDAEKADLAGIADLSFIDETPESARLRIYMPTRANYQQIVDNIMDLSHADYLHPTTLGGMMTGAKATSREEGDRIIAEWISEDCDPPAAFKPMVPHGKADVWIEVVWSAPALMLLGTGAKPAGVKRTREDESYTLHNMVPETETSTHYFVCNTRRFLVDDQDFTEMLRGTLKQAFVAEDKPMLEMQQARMGTPDLWALDPILLKVDAAAVRVRRKLDKLIDDEPSGMSGQ